MQLKPYTKLLSESWQEFSKDFQNYLTIAVVASVGLLYAIVIDFANLNNGMIHELISAALYIVFAFMALLAVLIKVNEKSKQLTAQESLTEAKASFGKVFSTYLVALILIILGFIAFIIPGIILSVMFSFVIPVALFEAKYGMTAIHQSRYYVKDYWWHIFGRFLFIGLIVAIPLSLLQGLLNPVIGTQNATYLSDFIGLLLLPLVVIYNYNLYQDLKTIKGQNHNSTLQADSGVQGSPTAEHSSSASESGHQAPEIHNNN